MESVQFDRLVTLNFTLNVEAVANICFGFWSVDVPPSEKSQNQAESPLPGAIDRSVKDVESPTQETAALNIAWGFGLTAICMVVSSVQLFEFVTVSNTE